MVKRLCLIILAWGVFGVCHCQTYVPTEQLFSKSNGSNTGRLAIEQEPAIDTLISRSILNNVKNGYEGFRIQVYYSAVRNAREESAQVRANFISSFPDIVSYAEYQEPGWFIIRVGDYRSKVEAYRDLVRIRKVFPNAYTVPTIIKSER